MIDGRFETGELSQIITDSGVTYARIGSFLGIRSQNVGHWVTFKRPIPEKHHKDLAEFLIEALQSRKKSMSKNINKLNKYLEEKCKTN